MLGDNAVYLAKEIEKLDMYEESCNRDDFIAIVRNNKVLITSFYHAVGDMCEMMFRFEAGNDRGNNMYGLKGKFDEISFLAHNLYLCANDDGGIVDIYPKNFAKISNDLEDMSIRLNYEIHNNMTVISNSRNKEYSKMEQAMC